MTQRPASRLCAVLAAGLGGALAFTVAIGLARAQDPAPAQAPPDGKALYEGACGACHGLDFVAERHKDLDGWTFTVRRMIDKGADLPYDAAPAVAEYLARTYPAPSAAAPAPAAGPTEKPPG